MIVSGPDVMAENALQGRIAQVRDRVADALRAAGVGDNPQLTAALVAYLIKQAPNASALRTLRHHVSEQIDKELVRRENDGTEQTQVETQAAETDDR
jgi:hypothetical protein